jgi:hypothetical protein
VPITSAGSEVVADGSVSATAFSVAEAISVGPLSIGRASDTVFSFGREGLTLAQQRIQLPAGEGKAALNQALAPAGSAGRPAGRPR